MSQKLFQLAAERDQIVAENSAFIGKFPDVRLSFWSFSLYKECPQKYIMAAVGKRRKVKKDNFHAISGSVVHSLMEDFTAGVKAAKHSWEDEDFLQEHAQAYYDRFVEENWVDWTGNNFTPTEHRNVHVPAIRRSLAQTYRMLRLEGLIPHPPHLVHSELSFQTTVADGAITLTGRVDKVFEYPDHLVVVDYKDVADKSNINWRQLVWYALGLEPRFNKPVTKSGFLLTKLNDWAWRDPQGMHRGDKQGRTSRQVLWEEILQTAKNIRQGNFQPKVSRFTCSYCPVKHSCPEWWSYAGQTNAILNELALLDEGKTSF